jgi:hypothetical protein
MKKRTSRQKILFAVWGMLFAILGDYLLGLGTFSMSSGPEAYKGIVFQVVPDWRYAVSSVLGIVAAAMFAVGAVELLRVMEQKYGLGDRKLFRLFKLANWGGILYFAFLHIAICMLPVVANAGMDATGDTRAAIDMTLRVAKSIAVPLGAAFLLCDGLVTVAWVGMVIKGMLPVRKIALICNPLMIALLGQSQNIILDGLDSGFESLGWLLMYLVCAMKLVEEREQV